jgi:hypothetical protein
VTETGISTSIQPHVPPPPTPHNEPRRKKGGKTKKKKAQQELTYDGLVQCIPCGVIISGIKMGEACLECKTPTVPYDVGGNGKQIMDILSTDGPCNCCHNKPQTNIPSPPTTNITPPPTANITTPPTPTSSPLTAPPTPTSSPQPGISRGVRGGLALPADEAEPAETPTEPCDEQMGDLEFSDDEPMIYNHDGEEDSDDDNDEAIDDDGDAVGKWDVRDTASRPGNLHKVEPMVNITNRTKLSEDETYYHNAVRCLELEMTEQEIMAVAPKKTMIRPALDSGAGEHVASADDVAAMTIRPSTGSKNNRHFVAANGQRIPNQGEVTMKLRDSSGDVTSTFQVAPVTRPLHSVSRMCDMDCEVKFTKTEGVVTKNGKVIARYPRVGGLYVAEFEAADKVMNDSPGNDSDFTRQGVKA